MLFSINLKYIAKKKLNKSYNTYIVRSGLDLPIEPMLIFVPKGRITDQEDVQYDTARPYVDWFSVWLLLQYLRTEIAGGSSETFLSIIWIHSLLKDTTTPYEGSKGSGRYVRKITSRVLPLIASINSPCSESKYDSRS